MKKTIKTILCAALGLAMILGMTGCSAVTATSAQATEPVSEITVSASGTVRLVPDKAAISFGVMTQERNAEDAEKKNAEAVNNVIAVLGSHGVEEKSIRTTYYSMYPQYDYSMDGDQRIIGYVVTTSMSVQDQDLKDVGKLLSACVDAGINSIDSVSFLCSGYDDAYLEALTKAVEASRVKAEALAAAAGKKLGDPVSILEGWQDTSARYGRNYTSMAVTKESAMDAAAPAFQPGETEITANVTVTFPMN